AAKSPADGTPRRSLLPVSARKIKDNAADWHNLMMKWERLNDNGFTTANKIANMKISEQFQDNKLEIACDNSATASEKTTPKYNEELDNCCTELLETLKHMVILIFSPYEPIPSVFKCYGRKCPQVSQTIVQEIAHTADQDLMMVYLSSWLYQPYIENSSKLLLEAMLLETGHRQC
ncbi:CINP protein, partial [Todus mexicanus]|nr:CINP protein [Todus mexicanus]